MNLSLRRISLLSDHSSTLPCHHMLSLFALPSHVPAFRFFFHLIQQSPVTISEPQWVNIALGVCRLTNFALTGSSNKILVNAVLEAGAPINDKKDGGMTPLALAKRRAESGTEDPQAQPIVDFLVSKGAQEK